MPSADSGETGVPADGRAAVPPPAATVPAAVPQLERSLGQRELVLLVVGAVIGSGIFIVPAAVLRQTGGAWGVALLVWLGAGVLSLLGALTYGELGTRRPAAGGLYVFMRDAFGAPVAFLYGWALFFVIATGSVATLSVAFTTYLRPFVALSPLAARLVSIAMIAVIIAINIRGTRHSARVQNVTTAIKAGAILLMGGLLLALGDGWAAAPGAAAAAGPWPDTLSLGVLSGVGLATIGVLWAYEGWQYATFAAGEVQDAQRVFPRGIALGTLALVALYMLANLAYLAALGPARAAASDDIAAAAVATVLGPAAGQLIALAILVSMFSAANAVVLTAPRVFFAMARDGVFFQRLALIHPRYGTPAFAVGACGAWAMVLAATGTFEQLLTYVVFAGWIFYGIGAASIFVLRAREGVARASFLVPGYPLTPLLFVLSAAAIVGNALVSQPARGAIGLAVVLAGVPAYLYWRRATPADGWRRRLR